MSSILAYTPALNYIGAVDISSAASGNTMFSVFYDQAIVALGNVLMFEYKLINDGDDVNPNNVYLGYVSIENATNTGISNQWSIAIPSQNEEYDPAIAKTVQVRVYIGLTSSSEIGVTEWSNQLEIHNPPPQPEIYTALYDITQYSAVLDDLYVFLNVNNDIDYDKVKFVAAFYYKSTTSGGSTVWEVSDPLSATDVTFGSTTSTTYKMLQLDNFGQVSTAPDEEVVYVSVYAVFPFTVNGSIYYSVSLVSTTIEATSASIHTTPTILSTVYNVYTTELPGEQIMVVSWEAPQSSLIPGTNVTKYILQKSTDLTNWINVDDDISSSTYFYNVNVSEYDCGDNIAFQVIAIFNDSIRSNPSPQNINSSLNYFQYATEPLNLTISNKSYNSVTGVLTMDINFSNPSTMACGNNPRFAVVVNNNIDGYVTYNSLTTQYTYPFSGITDQDGIVQVYLITYDTNPSVPGGSTYPERYSAIASTAFYATPTVTSTVYEVYTPPLPGEQTMVVTWEAPDMSNIPGTNVTKYILQKSINNGSWEDVDINISSSTYFYEVDVSEYVCGDKIAFQVIAIFNNSIRSNPSPQNINSSLNYFQYATEPLNLTMTNTGYNSGTGTVTMTINWKPPSTIACGDNPRFAVVVNNNIDGYVTYNSLTTQYTYPFSGITDQDGTVQVYLYSTDTNPETAGGSTYLQRNGAIASSPYIATNLVLEPVDYQVYATTTRGSQNMVLTWNTQSVNPWVATYDVYLNKGSGFLKINPDTISNTTYTYGATEDCGTTLTFYVKATITTTTTTGTVEYETDSNQKSINIFKYASAPTGATVQWAISNTTNTTMDMLVNFNNPSTNGCGNFVKFVVNVLNVNNTIIASKDVTTYVAGTERYDVNFDDIEYSSSGDVQIYMVTTDTNGGPDNDGDVTLAGYVADALPIFKNVDMNTNRTLLTFDVLSYSELRPYAIIVYNDYNTTPTPLDSVSWRTDGNSTGIAIVRTQLASSEYKYAVTMYPSLFVPQRDVFPAIMGVAVSNDVGIQEQPLQVQQP